MKKFLLMLLEDVIKSVVQAELSKHGVTVKEETK